MENLHTPVMTDELVGYLYPFEDSKFTFVDCTIGFGGHSKKVMDKYKNVIVIGIDRDIDAIKFSVKKFDCYDNRIRIIHDKFSNIENILNRNNYNNVDVIFLDLGVSSYQIDSLDRGFSYIIRNAQLDMRMDNINDNLTALTILNYYNREQLISVFNRIREICRISQLVDLIIERREKREWRRVDEFSELCESFAKYYSRKRKMLSSSLCFQALRIEVNMEVDELFSILNSSCKLLSRGGKIIILSYNSLEDGIVKNFFKIKAGVKVDFNNNDLKNIFEKRSIYNERIFNIVTKKPIRPTNSEIRNNPRASSARMRIAEKIN